MVESYKNKSRMWTLLMAVLTAIAGIGVDQWQSVLPKKYIFLAPIIVSFLGYFVAQYTEEKRVAVAEDLVHEEYKEIITPVLDSESVGDEEGA